MKKIFLALAVLCLGTLTSCNNPGLQQALAGMLANMMTPGSKQVYRGKATSLSMTGSANKANWNAINTRTATEYNAAEMNLTASNGMSGNTMGLVIPAYTDGKVTVNQITVSGLVLTTSNTGQTLSTGDNSTIDGTIVVNGTTYTSANLYIENATITPSSLSVTMTIYFAGASDGDDYSKAINYTFTGQLIEDTSKQQNSQSGNRGYNNRGYSTQGYNNRGYSTGGKWMGR